MKHTCPITGKPIPPNTYAHHTALQHLAQQTQKLAQQTQTLQQLINKTLNTPHTRGHTPPHHQTPINLTAYTHQLHATQTLTHWTTQATRHLNQKLTPTTPHTQTQWWQKHAHKLTTWPQAPQAHQQITQQLQTTQHITNPQRPRTYAGPCPNCRRDNTTRPGQTTTTCKCGHQINIQQAQQQMLTQLQQMILPTWQAIQATRIITGHTIPAATLRTWTRRGKLTPHQTPQGTPAYSIHELTQLANQQTHHKTT
jgi:DNA-binding IscR family transcriptional regulator